METTATPASAVAVRQPAAVETSLGEVTGGMNGIVLRYLRVVYGVGGLHDQGFDEGSIVLDGKYAVTDKKSQATVIVTGVTGYWKDWLGQAEFAAGIKSRRYATEQDAIAAGKRTEWINDPAGGSDPVSGRPNRLAPTASQAYDLKVLLRRPAVVKDLGGNEVNPEELFFVPIGEYFYCPAVMTFEKMAKDPFKATLLACMTLAAHEQKCPISKAALHRWVFTLGTEILPARGRRKAATIPVLRRKQTPEKKGEVLKAEEVAELEGLMAALSGAQPAEMAPAVDDANP